MPDGSGFPARPFFDAVYRGSAPWDIGAPQSDLIELIEEFPPSGTVLDLGSGTGDVVIGLARRGIPAIGVEFAEAAADVARNRLLELPPEQSALVEFEVGDALDPARWTSRIGAAADSGFYHLFDGPTRRSLVRALASALPPGGRYFMLGFSIDLPATDVPKAVTREEATDLFCEADGWVILGLRSASFHTVGFNQIPALALCAERVD